VGLSHQALLDTLAAEDVLAWAAATKNRVIEDFEANLVFCCSEMEGFRGKSPFPMGKSTINDHFPQLC
jgi:hypothetical protein